MDSKFINLSNKDDCQSLIREQCSSATTEGKQFDLTIEFAHERVKLQLRRLEETLKAVGVRIRGIGLLMMSVTVDEVVNMATIKLIILYCPNVQEFYAASLAIQDESFLSLTLQPFFGRLEKITLQFPRLYSNIIADCKKLKELRLEIMYDFNGDYLNLNFPELQTVNFSKVEGIDNDHLDPFLSKNFQLKKIELTRCAINPKILQLVAKHVPNIEELAFNFRRGLLKRSDMLENLKYLPELQHLVSLNLDCCGMPMADTIMKMAAKEIPLKRVGLFCCPWQKKYIEAFAALKDVKSLNLTNVFSITNDFLGQLSQSLSQLTDLTLKYDEDITIDGVIKFVRGANRLSTINLGLAKMSINGEQYKLLLEAVKQRPEKCKLTITLWGLKHSVKVSKDLLKQNIDFLEIISKEDEMNNNTEFDYYCGGDGICGDGGYDLVCFSPPPGCTVN